MKNIIYYYYYLKNNLNLIIFKIIQFAYMTSFTILIEN